MKTEDYDEKLMKLISAFKTALGDRGESDQSEETVIKIVLACAEIPIEDESDKKETPPNNT